MNPEVYQPKFLHEQARDYRAELDDILSKELTAESIDTYAEYALQQLISLVQDAAQDYSRQPTIGFVSEKEQEDATFHYFELDDLGVVLDHVADKADEIRGLDRIIGQAEVIDQIITPPDPTETQIKNGNGGFEEKRQIPRLKTVLFILSNEFGVDLEDAEQLSVRKGVMNGSTVRKSSYFMVEAKTINRTVLVCDEEENVTYVLDTTKLKDKNIPNIESLTKQQWNELILNDPTLGSKLVYSENFANNVVNLLRSESLTESSIVQGAKLAEYLKPKPRTAPEKYKSIRGIALELDVAPQTVSRAIEAMGEEVLGCADEYKFFSKKTKGYSPAQYQLIGDYLKAKKLLAPRPPKGFMSKKMIAEEFNIDTPAVTRAILKLGEDELGEINEYKFNGNIAEGFSPEQRQILRRYLEQKGTIAEKAPQGFKSLSQLSDELGIGRPVIKQAIKELGEEVLGFAYKYKFYSNTTEGYSPEQCQLIKAYLENTGNIGKDADGYMTVPGIAIELGVSRKIVVRIIRVMGEKLGEPKKIKLNRGAAFGYSPTQVERILDRFIDDGLCNQAPQDYRTVSQISAELQVAYTTILKAIHELAKSDNGMTPQKMKFRNGVHEGFSPEQFEQIRSEVERGRQKN